MSEDSFQDYVGVVIDLGSKFTKAGFSPESFPRTVFPTAVGRFRHEGLIDGYPELFFGNEAVQKQGVCNLTWPVEKGIIRDWDEMEKLWHSIFFRELLVAPETTKVLHSVHPLVGRKHREKMTEMLFETFAISHLSLVKTPVLVLHASGRTSGLVYENGAECAFAAPVFEGFPLKHATEVSPLTGERVTDVLTNLLNNIGYSFTTPLERQLVNDMKAKICYVASNYEEESKKHFNAQVKYKLPDGQNIFLGSEQFKCPEVLFQPSMHGFDCPNIVDTICSSIERSELEYQKMFYENIVISGGTTMLKGFPERLFRELSRRTKVQTNVNINIDEMNHREKLAWTGGSILASLEAARGIWVSKKEYEDIGADVVNYRFF